MKLEAADYWSLQPIWKRFKVHCPITDSDFDITYEAI